jgi:PTS system fructose-specific IIC component/fructose-specific PTS system IIC-like component
VVSIGRNLVGETRAVFRDSALHFRTGVSFMLPFLLIGSFMGSLAAVLGGDRTEIGRIFRTAGVIGVDNFVVVMAGYIAFSIGDNAAIAPGLLIGFLAKQLGLGYLGALLAGFGVGYAVRLLGTIKVGELWRSVWGMLAPVVATVLVALFMALVVRRPVALVTKAMTGFLYSLGSRQNALLGAVMGALGGLDFGGPFSKVQSTFATAVMDAKVYVPLGITGAFVTVPPLGMCLATRLAPRLYSESEMAYAKQSWLFALIGGFTEIVIPLATGDMWRVTAASVLGCVVTGTIAGFYELKLYTPVLGLPQWFFYDRPWVYLGALVPGVIVVALAANTLKSLARPAQGAVQ